MENTDENLDEISCPNQKWKTIASDDAENCGSYNTGGIIYQL